MKKACHIFVPLIFAVAGVIQLSWCSYFDEQTLFHVEWGGKVKGEKGRNEENLYVATRNNEKYVCYMPKEKDESEAFDLRDSFIPVPQEIDLLKPLFDKDVCVSKMTSYWTYELCHGKYLRQYHKEENVIRVSPSGSNSDTGHYILGNYREPDWRNQKQLKERYKSSEKPPNYRFSRVELPYFPVELDPGDICDLTQKPRQARVLYFCQPDTKAELYEIQEISTCSYELLVFTSYLCENKKYRAVLTSKDIGIKCYANDDKTPKKPVDLVKYTPSPPKYRDIFGKKPAKTGKSDDDDEDEDEYIDDFWVMDQMGLGPAPDLDSEDPFSRYGRKSTVSKARKAFAGSEFLVKPPAAAKPLVTDYQHVKDFLRGTYCLHGGMPGGWWHYELCFGQWARQYHEEVADDRRTQRTEVALGYWRNEKHTKWLQSNPSKRPRKPAEQRKSVTYFYGEGDICDATGLPRQTIVKLTCNPADLSEAIGISLSEPLTCAYEIDVIAGKWLCTVVRAADDDGIFDLESVIASLSGGTAPKQPSETVSATTQAPPTETLTTTQAPPPLEPIKVMTTTQPPPPAGNSLPKEPTPTPAPPLSATTTTKPPVLLSTRPTKEKRQHLRPITDQPPQH